jgi:predicted CopG family antitoxin
MTSKLISVREDIYLKLKKLKKPEESFSDLLERMLKTREKNPLKYFGIAKDLPKEILDEFKESVLKAKKEYAENQAKRFKELWGNENDNS